MKVCILGAGAYGSALACVLNENDNDVYIWTAFKDEALSLASTREPSKLPGVKLDDKIKVTSDIALACKDATFIVLAIPTAFIRNTLNNIKDYIKGIPICIASKGIEQKSCEFISEIVEDVLDTEDIAVLSGPSFAIDVAEGACVGLTLACQRKDMTNNICKAFCNSRFKLRVSPDIIGVEVCGAIKNVIAIASGMIAGMDMPESTTAMLITESVHDIKELIKGVGGDGDTISSYAGIGDLLLTAGSAKSRNYSFGYLIGKGASKDEIDSYIKKTTIEGLYTLTSIDTLLNDINTKMPLVNLIYDIIYGDKKPSSLIDFLISKP